MPILSRLIFSNSIVMQHQQQWRNLDISSYTMTIYWVQMVAPPPITIRVVDGDVVSAIRDGEQISASEVGNSMTIEQLFVNALNCVGNLFCRVEYDNEYGFPTRIGGGFIESSWIQVEDFQPILDP